ncbi:amino acid adenylation domain-containing protein [Streptomyces albus]|uniref:amino acid adenylation domain-containing protein n=1 Tax=Streptomyces albus TaxID=1888 RepID=UPI0024ACD71F|nr:amino acid adenylation domain-containing protein [Streptomyces albus]MDI6410069.1 amino acid adenylation domain-containing protein [Streptomyces albus]
MPRPFPPRPETGRSSGPSSPGGPAEDAGPVLLVTDRPRTVESSAGPVGRLRLAGAAGATSLAALALVLHRWTGQRRLLIDADLTDGAAGVLALTVVPEEPSAALLARTGAVVPHGTPTGRGVLFTDRPLPETGTWDLVVAQDGADLLLGCRTALFTEETAERLGRHLRLAAAFLADQPHAAVREADLLGAGERELVLRTFNDTARPLPALATVHGLFARQARRAPSAPAVTWRGTTLSYAELDERSDRLAAALRASGARPGDRVGLRTGRTPALIVGALGILKAGCAYLALEPDHPAERTRWLLADSDAAHLVVSAGTAGDFAFSGTVLDAMEPGAAAAAPHPDGAGAPGDLAYVCYTSGTTGTPKGVEVTHGNVVRLVCGASYVRFGPDMAVMPTGSVAFDASTFELWGPLLNGGRVHLTDSDTVLDAHALGRELTRQGITTLWLTSPLFNQLVEQDPGAFATLRELVVGGDALSPVHVAKAMDACPGLAVVNGYGPTENTTFSVTHRITRADLDRIPIGRPIANSTAYVLDEDGRPCPVGVPGELYLGGAGVARGYLGRPELTAERFVPDPFAGAVRDPFADAAQEPEPEAEPHPRPGAAGGGTAGGPRLYRSGDLARWRPDGVLEFLGRRDHQVKVRGFRIEPAEIEKAMTRHPGVAEAVVVARSRPGRSEKHLCGYYTGHPGGRADEHTGTSAPAPEDLRAALASALPDHMVPAFLVPLTALPLNHNGKVDRSRLPDPDGAHLLDRASYVPPRDETEAVLVQLAEKALGISGVGTAHDLRDLGADSLTATLLAAGVRQRLGRECPVSAVLADGTLARLAARLRAAPPYQGSTVPAAPRQSTHPLTPQQRQVYFEQLKDESAVTYNVPVTLALPADTEPHRLADALQQLAARHDALRTRFVAEDGEIRQRVEPTVRVPVLIGDGPPGPARDFVRPFDLGKAPLWRAGIHRTAAQVTLRLDLHHIVVDGYSLAPLFADLAALYAGQDAQPPPLQYRDYAHWLAGERGAALREAQRPYWEQVFATPPDPADLPTDMPRPPLRPLDGGVVTGDLGQTRTARLRAVAREHGVTLFAVLSSAHSLLLAALKGSTDVTVGVPVSGRTVPGLEGTVGMCANTVCLRTAVEPGLDYGTFLRRTAEAAEGAFAHQDFPFEDLVALAAPVRDYSRTPVFDALIALHSGRYLSVDFHGARVPLRLEQTGQAVFDLNMQIHEDAGTLRIAWQYASGLLRHRTVEGWFATFTTLLDALCADPSATLGTLLPGLARPPARPVPGPQAAPEPDASFDFDL